VPFPAGRLGEADLEQIWRSPDQSALLVGGRPLVLGRSAAVTAIRSRVNLLPYSTAFWTATSAKFAWQRYGVVIVDGRLVRQRQPDCLPATWEGRKP
jgi:hypothetical protein